MPLDPHVQRFLRVLEVTQPADPARQTDQQRRDGFRDLMRFSAPPPPIAAVEQRDVPGPDGPVPIRIFSPDLPSENLPGLIWCHGGGLVAGSVATHDALCRLFAAAIGCRVVSVDYRLAPEHKYPAAVTDCLAVANWVFDHAAALGVAPGHIAIGGDSAGGGLAAIVCQLLRQTPGRTFNWQLLLCPILDYAGATASRSAFAADRLVGAAMLARDLAAYLPSGVAAADPRISPLRAAELRGLPTAFIHTAEFDPMRDEGRAYADRLQAAGVSVSYTCHAGMIHLFYALSRVVPYAAPAMQRLAAEIRASAGDQQRV